MSIEDSADGPGANPRQGGLVPSGVRTSRLAIAALILGLLGFLVVPALAGLICGVVALIRIGQSKGALKGSGLAGAGIAVSAIMLLVFPVAILAALLLPALAKAKSKAEDIHSQNNSRQLALAVILYADNHQDRLPDATNWCDAILPHVSSRATFLCPGQPESAESGFGFNVKLSGLKPGTVDKDTVMLFELDVPGWNVAGGPELLRRPMRRRDSVAVSFMDGHVELLPGHQLDQLRWDP